MPAEINEAISKECSNCAKGENKITNMSAKHFVCSQFKDSMNFNPFGTLLRFLLPRSMQVAILQLQFQQMSEYTEVGDVDFPLSQNWEMARKTATVSDQRRGKWYGGPPGFREMLKLLHSSCIYRHMQYVESVCVCII